LLRCPKQLNEEVEEDLIILEQDN